MRTVRNFYKLYAYFLHSVYTMCEPVRTNVYFFRMVSQYAQRVHKVYRGETGSHSMHNASTKCTWGVRRFAQYAQSAHKVHMGGEKFAKSVHQDRHARHIVPVLSTLIWLARDTDASLWTQCSTPGCSCRGPTAA